MPVNFCISLHVSTSNSINALTIQSGQVTGLAKPRVAIDTTNGAFSLMLDAGDYTVSLPLVPTRRPFLISVFATSGT
jgi:hypothetical protein